MNPREIFSAGIATISGFTNKLFATSVAIKAISRTTTGPSGQQTRSHHLSLTAARPVSPVTANMWLDEDHGASQTKRAAWLLSIQQMAGAASSLGHSKSTLIKPELDRQLANWNSWKINLGPIQTTVKDAPPNPQADGLGYNPRCLSRDISTQASNETRDEMVVDLIKNYPDILSFQNKMQNFTQGVMGVHNGGHYTIGGDSGMDMYASPRLGTIDNTRQVLTKPQVQLASRPSLLLPPRHDRSRLVDMAEPRFEKPAE